MGVPDGLVAFFIDATLDPAREGPFEQKEEFLPHIGPLACRRKRDAPQVEGVHQTTSLDHLRDLRQSDVFLAILAILCRTTTQLPSRQLRLPSLRARFQIQDSLPTAAMVLRLANMISNAHPATTPYK